ncbi:MAG: class II fructose-1,6-bisphosphate aldolase [Clostridia bacterium]|nr:class II fructose-1,6-bisphosphate aldolase [Clostridia bacterium]
MGLVTTREMFERAAKGGYAIGAFNVNNMEIVQGIVEAAAEANSPVILQASSSAIKYAGPTYLKKMIEAAIEINKEKGMDIPIALHLDHGADFEICKECIDSGFTSVMIDGSKYPFEENVALTKKVVDYAHMHGVSVEAELGKLAGVEDDVNVAESDANYTDPKEAAEFVRRTGCDSLAVAVGTSHGAYKFKGEPRLRFDILEKISEALPENYPLVLHGASSVPQEYVEMCNKYGGKLPGARGVTEDLLARASKMGVCKINVDSDIRLAMTASIRKVFTETPEVFDPRNYLGKAREEIKKMISHRIIDVFGSQNKA